MPFFFVSPARPTDTVLSEMMSPRCPVGDVAAAGSWLSGGQAQLQPRAPPALSGIFFPVLLSPGPGEPGQPSTHKWPWAMRHPRGHPPVPSVSPPPQGQAPSSAGLGSARQNPRRGLGGVGQHPAGKSRAVIKARDLGQHLGKRFLLSPFLHVGFGFRNVPDGKVGPADVYNLHTATITLKLILYESSEFAKVSFIFCIPLSLLKGECVFLWEE